MPEAHDQQEMEDRLWKEVDKGRFGMLGVVGGLVLGATPLARGLQWVESRLPDAAPRTL